MAIGYLGGDPAKLNRTGYTKGDIVVASSAGALTPLPVGANSNVTTANSVATLGVDWEAGGGGGGGTPSNTVVTEQLFAQASTAGVASPYSRGDHTHGTPAAPTAASVGAAPTGRLINTTAPIAGGGDLSADRTISLNDGGVTNTKLANMNAATIKGNNTGAPAAPIDLTAAQTKTLLAITESDVTNLVTDLSNKQPLDSDLTTIAGLTATTDNFIQSKASAWSSRTPAQVAADIQGSVTIAESQVTNLVTDLGNKQPLDSDLTTIAGLTATTDNVIQSVAGAWASRTPAQVKAALAIAESDVTNLVTDLGNKQPLDSDLTTIAGLTATTDSFIQSKASAWSARTVAQVLTDLAVPGTTFQPLDSDLTTIAGLTATTDNFIQSKGSAWSSRTVAQVLTDLAVPGTTFQPLDSDLTTIAGLTATTNNFIVSVASAWASRTPAQVKTTLAIVESDVTNLVTDLAAKAPLASPTFTGTVTEPAVTRTGRTLRTYTVLTDAATVLVDASLNDHFTLTLGGNRTLGNPSNVPGAGQSQLILFAIRQDGTGSRTLALGTDYRLGTDITTTTLTTAANKTDYMGVRFNVTDAKWDVISFVKGY